MDNVDKLVEWVAGKLCDMTMMQIPYKHLPEGQIKNDLRAMAKQILSHPDLALIDRTEDFVTCPRCEGTVWRPYPSPNGAYYVIPLAKEIERVDNE